MIRVDDCVLCKIADGKLPSRKMYEEKSFLGILDVNPYIEGHCLVVPKEHVIQFYEMDDDALVYLFRLVKIVAREIRKVFTPDFVCVFIRGGRIPHLYVAVFPSMLHDSLSGLSQSSFEKVRVDLDSAAEKLSSPSVDCH